MPFALNTAGHVVGRCAPRTASDRRTVGPAGIEQVDLDLAARDAETHCLVALPALPNAFAAGTAPASVGDTRSTTVRHGATLPFVLYLAA